MNTLSVAQKIEDIYLRVWKKVRMNVASKKLKKNRTIIVRSSRGLGDLIIDIGYIAASIGCREDMTVKIKCRGDT